MKWHDHRGQCWSLESFSAGDELFSGQCHRLRWPNVARGYRKGLKTGCYVRFSSISSHLIFRGFSGQAQGHNVRSQSCHKKVPPNIKFMLAILGVNNKSELPDGDMRRLAIYGFEGRNGQVAVVGTSEVTTYIRQIIICTDMYVILVPVIQDGNRKMPCNGIGQASTSAGFVL